MNPHQEIRVRKSLKYSVLDGSAHSAMLGTTQDYIAPFALALRATTAQVGLLASVPSLFMALSQLAAPGLVARAGSRKRFVSIAILVQALMWLPILLVPFLFDSGGVLWLIGFVTLGAAIGALGNPAWGSMMADLVPMGQRGRYFGLRGKICSLTMLLLTFAAGLVLHFLSSSLFLGFAIIFGSAALFRLASWGFFSRMHEPDVKMPPRSQQTGLLDTFKQMTSSNLGRFTIYVSMMNFATYLAAPFFAVYMLRDLHFDYLTYVVVAASPAVANLAFLTFWGRRSDRAGNIKIIRITSMLIPIVPILWLVSNQFYYLIPIQLLSGFAWAGFNLSTINFLYDASAPADRTRCIAIFNAITGISICLGSVVGGFLAAHLPPLLGYNLMSLFVLSGIVRGLVVVIFLNRVVEVRHVPRVSTQKLLLGDVRLVWPGLLNIWLPLARLELNPVRLPTRRQAARDMRTELHWRYVEHGSGRSPPAFCYSMAL